MIKNKLIKHLELSPALKGLPIGYLLVEDALDLRNFTFKTHFTIFHNPQNIRLDGKNVLQKGCPIPIKDSYELSNILQHFIRYFNPTYTIKYRCAVCLQN